MVQQLVKPKKRGPGRPPKNDVQAMPDLFAVISQAGRQQTRSVAMIPGQKLIAPIASNSRERNPDPIDFPTYDELRRDPTVKAALTVIKAPIIGRARTATVTSEDPKVKAFVTRVVLESGLLTRLVEQSLHALEFGVSFNEKVWDVQELEIDYDEIVNDLNPVTGLPQARTVTRSAWRGPALVYKDIVEVNPATVEYIKRRGEVKDGKPRTSVDGKPADGSYDGFVQRGSPPVDLDTQYTFVFTHDSEFGNMWGSPRTREAYAPWFWRNQAAKLWMQWGEKKASSPRVAYHPDGFDQKTGRSHAELAVAVGNMLDGVTTVALPSVRDKDGNLLWEFKELTVSDRTDIFEKILAWLTKEILWAVFVPEQVFTNDQQQKGGGNYAQSSAHTDTWLMTLDALLLNIIQTINRWVIAPLVAYNFGAKAKKAVVTASGLTDEERAFLREVFMKLLDDTPRFRAQVSFSELADQFAVPQQEVDPALMAGFQNNVSDQSGDSGRGNNFDNAPRPGRPDGARSEQRTAKPTNRQNDSNRPDRQRR